MSRDTSPIRIDYNKVAHAHSRSAPAKVKVERTLLAQDTIPFFLGDFFTFVFYDPMYLPRFRVVTKREIYSVSLRILWHHAEPNISFQKSDRWCPSRAEEFSVCLQIHLMGHKKEFWRTVDPQIEMKNFPHWKTGVKHRLVGLFYWILLFRVRGVCN